MKLKIGVSARHVHLTKEHINILFGEGHELSPIKDLSQPLQYAAAEKVTLKTSKNTIENVRVLGPARNYTQVEISKTDAHVLGLNPPVRESGDILGSEGITLIGPVGSVDLKEGCIIATRHIHMTKEDLLNYGLLESDVVSVLVGNEKKALLLNVSLKVSDKYSLEFHIDLDDANANFVTTGDEAIIVKN